MNSVQLSSQEIARRLATFDKYPFDTGIENLSSISDNFKEPVRPAAVLIPFLVIDNTWHILFIRRTTTLADHSGQVAFPGGRLEPKDNSPRDAAMREAKEEIGLNPKDVYLLGELPPLQTITNYLVTPLVGVIPWPYPLNAAPEEVSRIFTIPLSWLSNPANHRTVNRPLPASYGTVTTVYYSPYEGEILWGVTAKIVLGLLQVLFY